MLYFRPVGHAPALELELNSLNELALTGGAGVSRPGSARDPQNGWGSRERVLLMNRKSIFDSQTQIFFFNSIESALMEYAVRPETSSGGKDDLKRRKSERRVDGEEREVRRECGGRLEKRQKKIANPGFDPGTFGL